MFCCQSRDRASGDAGTHDANPWTKVRPELRKLAEKSEERNNQEAYRYLAEHEVMPDAIGLTTLDVEALHAFIMEKRVFDSSSPIRAGHGLLPAGPILAIPGSHVYTVATWS